MSNRANSFIIYIQTNTRVEMKCCKRVRNQMQKGAISTTTAVRKYTLLRPNAAPQNIFAHISQMQIRTEPRTKMPPTHT